ncbi:hypothetical protein AAG906_013509 [Vitis piasezkii]
MESSVKNSGGFEKGKDGFESSDASGVGTESVTDSSNEVRAKEPSPPTLLGWPIRKAEVRKSSVSDVSEDETKSHLNDSKVKQLGSKVSEIEMMKERFSKLLLGEDMSGSGKGVCTALAISNAITNLCATIFGQLWRLEPLPPEKKSMWRREMELLLCVSDHIVQLIPSWQTFPDGSKLEVMTCRPRSDIFINLPALRKLDNMLLEILDGFTNTEFWYVDQGIIAPETDGSASFRKPIQRQEEKWWLPVPRVPPGGLSENSRKQLNHKRESANQILKAAMAINSNALAEMEVPESFWKLFQRYDASSFLLYAYNGRACLGDIIYRYITSDQFSSECLLDCLDLSSEHVALEIANRVEASIYVWRRRTHHKPMTNPNRSTAKSSWEMELLAERAESLFLSLKQRFPGLTQTTLDTSKIQCNKVQTLLHGYYSRVLESLAFNIVARIDDLLYVDDLNKQSDKHSSVPTVSVIAHKRVSIPYSVPVSSTPQKTALTTLSRSPAPLISPARGERTPFLHNKPPRRGFGVKRVLNNYLGVETKTKNSGNPTEGGLTSTIVVEAPATRTETKNMQHKKESVTHQAKLRLQH